MTAPYSSKDENGRLAVGRERVLRIQVLSQWFSLSDIWNPGVKECYGSGAGDVLAGVLGGTGMTPATSKQRKLDIQISNPLPKTRDGSATPSLNHHSFVPSEVAPKMRAGCGMVCGHRVTHR